MKNNPDINSIKIDIEGAEMEILENCDFTGLKKMCGEWSFDADKDTQRFLKCIVRLEKYFKIIHFNKAMCDNDKNRDRWTTYPRCIKFFCINQ